MFEKMKANLLFHKLLYRPDINKAYAMVKETGSYSIVAPIEYQQDKESIPWMLIGYGGAIALVGVGSSLLYLAKKRKEEGEEQYV